MNPRTLFLAAVAWLALPHASVANKIHVPADEPTIQQGINAAQPGDMVLVAPGTYSGANNQDLDFLGKDITVASEAGPLSTVIDPIPNGQGVGRAFHLHTNETQDALIEGFTIQGGAGPSSGGVFLHFASPTLRNCVFTGNGSAGLEVRGEDMNGGPFPFVTLENCVFTGNTDCGLRFVSASGAIRDCQFTANNGWGIILNIGFWGAGPVNHLFERCTISANTAGGIQQPTQGSPTFVDCLISDHPAGGAPGMSDQSEHGSSKFYRCTFRRNLSGAYSLSGITFGPYFEDCTFEENSATNAGAIFLANPGNSDPVDIQRCRFINNSASQGGGAIGLSEGNIVIENSVFWNNTAGQQGGAIAVLQTGAAFVTLRSCTIAGGGAPVGGGISANFRARFTFDHSIIAFTAPGPAVGCGMVFPNISANCTDIFGNFGGDWVGCMAGMNVINGNLVADPRFCDFAVGDLTLADDSPCAPAHSGTCGLIGALPVACGVTSVEPTTWGKIKAGFD